MSKIKYMKRAHLKCENCGMTGFSTFVDTPTIECPLCDCCSWEVIQQGGINEKAESISSGENEQEGPARF